MNPSAEIRASGQWWWKQLFMGVIFLALAFGLAIGSLQYYSIVLADAPTITGDVPFKDVLLTVLAIAGIFITVFGSGVFFLIRIVVVRDLLKQIERNRRLADARNSSNTGVVYYELYQVSGSGVTEARRQYLAGAIMHTKLAYRTVVENLDEKEWDVEKLLTNIRNNWAYYIFEMDARVERVAESEAVIALGCLTYIEQRSSRFPELTEEIIDTISKVAGRFRPATA